MKTLKVDMTDYTLFEVNKKSTGTSYLLWFLLGTLGAHRFYNGRIGSALVQVLLTICTVIYVAIHEDSILPYVLVWGWWLIDAFLIPQWVDAHNGLLARQLNIKSEEPKDADIRNPSQHHVMNRPLK
jgi:TM2 domain-containing membrane protein YozV